MQELQLHFQVWLDETMHLSTVTFIVCISFAAGLDLRKFKLWRKQKIPIEAIV